ncbi:hypothetical protein ABE28_021405 [Peribacillus muralis]|uniref:Uncharacterized protein n=1 Tax=Peribacillus muralis TaxID=264697 RepID=A0A1B3XUM8_9BACI|nr:hypothetical protein [Peribacillus muralis]AOH56910.1 hypothetical protein ABE28_021405 [Peribacillus muralis]
MKRKLKTLVLLSTFLSVLSLPLYASAYSKSYSFDMKAGFDGSTTFSLSNAKASTTVKAGTYHASGKASSDHSKYSVALNGGLLNYYGSGNISANGLYYTKSFGTVSKKSYKLRLSKTSKTGYKVKGSGTINQ